MDVKLVMFKKDGQQKSFSVGEGVTVLGRAEDCELRLPIANVSRRHCELHVGAEAVTAKDLGSSNGTYVNNKRVTECGLKAGDRLVVGPVVFTVQIDGVPGEIQHVKTRGQLLAESGETGVDELVDLEENIVAQPGASDAGGVEMEALESEEDIDPISALEALAAESDEDDQEQDKE